jgi:hypothetical protein
MMWRAADTSLWTTASAGAEVLLPIPTRQVVGEHSVGGYAMLGAIVEI